MQNKSQDSAEAFHQRISLLFHLMIALPLAVFIYLFLEMKHHSLAPVIATIWLQQVINFGIVLISILTVTYVYTRFRRELAGIRGLSGLRTKLGEYLSLCLRMYLILGVLAGLLVLGLFLTTSPVLIVAYVILLFLLSLHRPTPRKYVSDLNLEGEEKEAILKKQQLPLEDS